MIYLDNSATTRPFQSALSAMERAAREGYFNPSSLYAQAMDGQKLLRGAQDAVRGALGARGGSVVLTSGGTESDNLAILGAAAALRARKGHFLYGAAEHPAVSEAMQAVRAMGHDVEVLPVDATGAVTEDALRAHMREDTALISVQHVNNETGTINPAGDLARIAREIRPEALFHVDGVQGFLRVPPPEGVDLYALSAHKIHGPRGVGALWMSPRAKLLPLLRGGGQQEGLRSGTENVPGAEGLRAAIEELRADAELPRRLMEMKLRLYHAVMDALPDAVVNGPAPECAAPHILNMSFGVRGEILLHALEGEGILVSTGSACSSRKKKPSATLTAMGATADAVEGAIRFSLSPENTAEEMDIVAETLARLALQYRRYRRK